MGLAFGGGSLAVRSGFVRGSLGVRLGFVFRGWCFVLLELLGSFRGFLFLGGWAPVDWSGLKR